MPLNTQVVVPAQVKLPGSSLSADEMPSGIDAAKIADGTVSSAEFQRINSLTSNAQDQLNTNAAAIAASLLYLAAPGTAQTITTASFFIVTWGTPSHNDLATYSAGTWTMTVAGVFDFFAGVFSSTSSNAIGLIYVNGTEVLRSPVVNINSMGIRVAKELRLSIGDTVAFRVYNYDASAALDLSDPVYVAANIFTLTRKGNL